MMNLMRLLLIAWMVVQTSFAFAGPRPTAVLCNGFTIYGPNVITKHVSPLAGIGRGLEKQGYRVVITTHATCDADGEEPVLIIGHSAGGAAALAFAKQQFENVKFQPTLILLDAAPWWNGVWKSYGRNCYSIRTPGYPQIPGCKNIPAPALPLAHVTIAFSDSVQKTVLAYSARLLH